MLWTSHHSLHPNFNRLAAIVRDLILGDVVLIVLLFGGVFFRKSVKTAVPDDGRPPGTLVLTKLIEETRCEVGHTSYFFQLLFVVRGVCCVFLGSTEAAFMGNFTPARKMCHENCLRTQWSASRATVKISRKNPEQT